MSSSPKRIQASMKLANHPLFQIKDLTSVISNYAVDFPKKLIHHQDSVHPFFEIRFCTDMLIVNARFDFSGGFLLVEEDDRLTEIKQFKTQFRQEVLGSMLT